MHHWVKIYESAEALENNISLNKSEVFVVKGEKVCVARTIDGFFVVQDRCPHNGAELSKGFCSEKNEIICPIHRYSFNLKSGKATSGGSYTLKTYPLDITNKGVFVGVKAKWWEM